MISVIFDVKTGEIDSVVKNTVIRENESLINRGLRVIYVDHDFSVNDLKIQKYNNNKLIELFENLEFNNLTKKIKNTTSENEKKEDQLNLFSNK